MIVKIFANYGVLAHEKETIYSVAPHPHAVLTESVTVDLPNELFPYETVEGSICVLLGDQKYLLAEALTNAGDLPALKWFDGQEHHTITLPVVE